MCLLSELILSRTLGVAGAALADDAGRPFPEPGTAPNYARDRGCVVTQLDIGLRIDPTAQTMVGDTVVTVAPLPSGRLDVVLDLDDVTVQSVEDGDGNALDWRHGGGELRVRGLPASGGKVRVRYGGRPGRGLYFTGPTPAAPERPPMAWTQCQDEDGHRVFPCHDAPGIKQPVRMRVTAPADSTVVGNGRLVGQAPADDGFVTWTWDQPEPIPAYLVMLAIGPFVTVEAEADNAGAPLPLRYLAPPESTPEQLERVFGRTPEMVSFLAKRFGVAYPWARYDQVVVHDFIFGGMENVAATTLTDLMLTDERAHLDADFDDLIVHELAHQWFGDLVTCQDWSQAWLNEGWATYTEYLWQHHHEGADEAHMGLLAKLGGYLAEDGGRYRRSITHYNFKNPIDMFDRHLYEKGGLVLHTLRGILGEDAFWTGVTAYLRAHAHGAVHTRDFQRAMETASGRNLDGFFQQFVHGAGHPELDVSVSHGDGLLNVSVTQKQSGPQVAEAFHFPLVVDVVAEDGGTQRLKLPVDARSRSFAIPMADAPARVEVDPDMAVLSKLTLKAGRPLLLAALKDGSSVPVRLTAAAALLEEGSVEAVAAVCAALTSDAFWGVRAKLAGALAKRGGPEARAALLGAMDDPHPKARRAIVAALGSFRSADVRDALVAKVEAGDASVQVEGEAIKSLGRTRDPRVAALAPALLAQDSWGDLLRMRALEALGATRDGAVLGTLLAHTAETASDRARFAAAGALGQLAHDVEAARPEAADRLMELAQDAPFRVRLAAVPALGRSKDMRGMGVLSQVHASGGDGMLSRRAYEAKKALLSGSGAEAAVGKLRDQVEALTKENHGLRTRVEKLEGRLGDAAE
jgi:aminopeptidase N